MNYVNMATAKVKYLGELRTIAVHLRSNSELISDAPIDNNGKGQAFSPTDTVATALASCMMTIMGIRANEHGWNIAGTSASVTKIMRAKPRAISEILIDMQLAGVKNDESAQRLLTHAALNCPVAKSLSENIKQVVNFKFV